MCPWFWQAKCRRSHWELERDSHREKHCPAFLGTKPQQTGTQKINLDSVFYINGTLSAFLLVWSKSDFVFEFFWVFWFLSLHEMDKVIGILKSQSQWLTIDSSRCIAGHKDLVEYSIFPRFSLTIFIGKFNAYHLGPLVISLNIIQFLKQLWWFSVSSD